MPLSIHQKNQAGAKSEDARLLALVNSMSDAFFDVDETGRIALTNAAALNLLDANILIGKNITEVLGLIDKTGQPLELQSVFLAATKDFSNRDWKLRYKDGSTIDVQVNVSVVRASFGSNVQGGHIVLLRDITQEKEIENERDEFVSVASHELRTPVAIAEGSLSNALVLAEKNDVPSTVKQTLKAAHDQIIFLSNLVNDLAMLSRLVESLARDYSNLAAAKKIQIKTQVASGASELSSSQLYVREILQNFITNAIKYTDKGFVTIAAAPREDGVEFAVTDTGIGISQSDMNKMFSKFFRSSDWRVRGVNGTGLGLYVTSKLARLINAEIAAHSELNKGSSFSIYIPNIQATK
jgi:PAS domain S-box-containing protein